MKKSEQICIFSIHDKYSPLPKVVNGITVNTYVGKWKIDAWQTELDVKYFWSSKIIS